MFMQKRILAAAEFVVLLFCTDREFGVYFKAIYDDVEVVEAFYFFEVDGRI